MYIAPTWFIHSSTRWAFRLTSPLPIFIASNIPTIMNIAAMNICTHTVLCELVYNSLGYIPSEESLGHMVTFCVQLLEEPTDCFPWLHVYNPTACSVETWISPHLPWCYFPSFDFNRGYVVMKWYVMVFVSPVFVYSFALLGYYYYLYFFSTNFRICLD